MDYEHNFKIYFSDFFDVDPQTIEEYGAFNISLISDLPLFIDPFLLFNSKNEDYKNLHDQIICYLSFLKDKSCNRTHLDEGLLKRLYVFKEVKQNWFGFSDKTNSGSGLGIKFARSLHKNLNNLLSIIDKN